MSIDLDSELQALMEEGSKGGDGEETDRGARDPGREKGRERMREGKNSDPMRAVKRKKKMMLGRGEQGGGGN